MEDLPNSMMCKVTVDTKVNEKEEIYLPKQLADLITSVNSLNILARSLNRSVTT